MLLRCTYMHRMVHPWVHRPSQTRNADRREGRRIGDCNWWVTFGFGGVAVTCQSQQCQSHVDGIEKSNGRTNFSYLSLQLTR